MKIKSILLISTILLIAVFTSSCSGSATVASGWASVATDGETAYLAYNTAIHAINLDNGTERWRFPTENDPKITFYAAPTLTEDGQLIAGGYDNILYSLNPETGAVNWTFDEAEGRYIGGTLAAGGKLFAPSADHKLYALGANGTALWAAPFETAEPLWAQPVSDADCNCIYLPSMDHKVYAIDIQTGNPIWVTADLGGAIVGVPAISADQIVYVGTFANELVAIDAKNGETLWRFETEKWVWAGPAIDETNVYFGDLSGTLYALNRLDGSPVWQVQPGGAIVGKPLLHGEDILITTEDGSVVAISSEGAIRWNQPISESLHSGPVSAGETILIATADAEKLLVATDNSGVQKWAFGLEK